MKTIKIRRDAEGQIGAFIIQKYNNEEQVLKCKWFASEKAAMKWANKQI